MRPWMHSGILTHGINKTSLAFGFNKQHIGCSVQATATEKSTHGAYVLQQLERYIGHTRTKIYAHIDTNNSGRPQLCSGPQPGF